MKKVILLTAMLLATASSMQAENKLTASNVEIVKGDSAELVISMENDFEVGGYDFHLYLPMGIDLAYDQSEEDFLYELSNRHNKNHQLTIRYDETDNSYLLLVADPSLHKIKDYSGEIISLKLTTTNQVIPGTYQGSIQKIWFAENGSSGVEVEDVAFEIEVTNSVGISDILESDDAPWYNLSGMKVSRPAAKGIYIRNGRKVVVK